MGMARLKRQELGLCKSSLPFTRPTRTPNTSFSYAFDVIERAGGQFLANKRVFAMADAGIPDGIKCDTEGNVYAGCFDGVEVWNAAGRLLGKILVPGGVANFCFTRPGELFMCNEKRVVVAHFSPKTQGALLFNLGHRDLQARTR